MKTTFALSWALQLVTTTSLIINTSSGRVVGHPAHQEPGVTEYLRIPYAKPPLGDLRFARPQKLTSTAIIDSHEFGFACPANAGFKGSGGSIPDVAAANLTAAGLNIAASQGQVTDIFGEDCLHLNVWVPDGGEAEKAVLLWIYGGGWQTGSASIPTYNGQRIAAKEDVIVVSFNYRLNIFGFPGNPAELHQNLGFLDQRLAIEWVRDNIAAFGGDANRIVAFGQSAGSGSIDYYSYAYASNHILAGIILQSGAISGFTPLTAAQATSAWFNATSYLGCGNASSDISEVVYCMRTIPFQSILGSIAATAPPSSLPGLPSSFIPTVDNINVFSDYVQRGKAGNFAKVPLLIGNNDYEAGGFVPLAALQDIFYPQTFWDAFDSSVFNCPTAVRANISAQHNIPTWRYRWFGNFPNTKITSVPDSGAYHASEVAVLFDQLPVGPGIPLSIPAEVSIGEYTRGAWAIFAKDPTNGLKFYGWPEYAPNTTSLVRLAFNNQTGPNLAAPTLYDHTCL